MNNLKNGCTSDVKQVLISNVIANIKFNQTDICFKTYDIN